MNWKIERHPGIFSVAFAGALLALPACSDSTGSAAHGVSLSMTTRAGGLASSNSIQVSRDIAVGPAGELVLKKVQLVLGKVELSRSDATACVEDDDQGDDDARGGDDLRDDEKNKSDKGECEDVSKTPLLANVPVDDAVHTVISVPVAAGTYTRLEAKLTPADAATIATLGAPADMTGKSVRVEGTYKGTPFVYTSPIRTHLEFEFDPPLVVDGTGKNATINIDVTRWFTNAAGAVIDPATANAGGINAKLVESNIRSSFKAFEDDDRKGDDDHEGEHHGG
jgi:hypothetical protein